MYLYKICLSFISLDRTKVGEFTVEHSGAHVQLVGVKINVNGKIADDQDTSFIDVTERLLSREKILAFICNRLEVLLTWSFEQVTKEYLKYDQLVGKVVTVTPKVFLNSISVADANFS